MELYGKLKDLRKLKGYTIRELAERSGVSSAYISQLENGNRGLPSPDVLMKLSEGLNMPYAELMRLAGYLELADPSAEGEPARTGKKAPVNLRRFLRDNDIMFDSIELTQQDKEWVERMLSALFWKEKRIRETESGPDPGQE